MQIRGPLATLLSVLVAGAAVVATNLVLTDDGPEPERTASLGLSRSASSSGTDGGDAEYGAAPAAPAAPAAGAPASYDGRTAGDEVTVALKVEDGGAATAYVCDGKDVESWMHGTVQGSEVSLTGKDGAVLDGRAENGTAFGTVQVGGKSWPFAAAVPKKSAPSGNAPTGGWS